ncbi:MAG TPA: hypothetical protein VF516_25570 [Kofleriaceae bacterium]
MPEVGRVVRPGGLIAPVTYFNAELDGEAGALLAGFYADIVPHWPGGRTHVNNRYRDLTFPWPAVEPPAIALTAPVNARRAVGYVTTWSATARLVAAGGARGWSGWGASWPSAGRATSRARSAGR